MPGPPAVKATVETALIRLAFLPVTTLAAAGAWHYSNGMGRSSAVVVCLKSGVKEGGVREAPGREADVVHWCANSGVVWVAWPWEVRAVVHGRVLRLWLFLLKDVPASGP